MKTPMMYKVAVKKRKEKWEKEGKIKEYMIADGEEVVAGDENADDLAVLPPVIKTSMVIDEEDGRGMNYEEIAEEGK